VLPESQADHAQWWCHIASFLCLCQNGK